MDGGDFRKASRRTQGTSVEGREVTALRGAARSVIEEASDYDELGIPALATLRAVLGESE
jgi:hypothetical protein